MARRLGWLLVWGVLLVSLDQITKAWILQHMVPGQSLTVVPHFFHITFVHNSGAAFGLFAEHSYGTLLLTAISFIAVLGIAGFILFSRQLSCGQFVALALIWSGAVGNLIDRLRFGAVIDFLDVHYYQYHWPAFNVADSAISVGVVLLAIVVWTPGAAAGKA